MLHLFVFWRMRNFRTVFYAPLLSRAAPQLLSCGFLPPPAALRSLLAGSSPPLRPSTLPPSDLTQVDKDLRQMLLRPDAPAPRKVAVRVWPRAIPRQARPGRAELGGGQLEAGGVLGALCCLTACVH